MTGKTPQSHLHNHYIYYVLGPAALSDLDLPEVRIVCVVDRNRGCIPRFTKSGVVPFEGQQEEWAKLARQASDESVWLCRRELLRGPLYYVLVLLAVTVCFWRCSPAGLIPIALMSGGDGIADIVGRRYGAGNPLPHNRNKSWAGSAAMFIGTVPT